MRLLQYLSLFTIGVTGFASALGQILIVRELLVLFYGNELSTGLIFTSWLLWNAVGSGLGSLISDFRFSKDQTCGILPILLKSDQQVFSTGKFLSIVLIFLSLSLSASILWIRASRIIWNISIGEILPPLKMLAISLTATGLFCTLSGFLFSLTWAVYVNSIHHSSSSQPVAIYLAEALGAAFAGIFFYFFLLPYISVLGAALITSCFLLIAAVGLAKSQQLRANSFFHFSFLILFTLLLIFLPQLDHISRQWQWGRQLITVRDTPYNNLAILKSKDQFTVFANGLWSFSVPDPQSAESAVHLTLLQHPQPKTVLLIGGGSSGQITEIFKHTSVKQIDYIEPDPELIRLAEEYLPDTVTAWLENPAVRVFHKDAGSFIQSTGMQCKKTLHSEQKFLTSLFSLLTNYDVILMNVGDPMNAQMNRFYTTEFYHRIRKRLNPGGIFSFSVSSSPDMLGSAQIQFLQSVYATLHESFSQITIYHGDNARFFATDTQGTLITNPDELITRMETRKLRLQYIQPYYLFDILNPLRLEYFNAMLTQERSARSSCTMINRDFAPTCYFYNLVLWGAQVHETFKDILITLSQIKQWQIWTGAAVFIFVINSLFIIIPHANLSKAVAVNVMAAGGMIMVLQIAALLSFQILAGFVYKQLALIIASFMTGLALGAGLIALLEKKISGIWLIMVQAVLSLYLIAFMGFVFVLRHYQENIGAVSYGCFFSGFALIGGILGGGNFALAVKTVSGDTTPSAKIGGGLYALDLMGSAAGALIASLFLLPIYGLPATLGIFSLLGIGNLPMLIYWFIRK